jgi:hypothetical protein
LLILRYQVKVCSRSGAIVFRRTSEDRFESRNDSCVKLALNSLG